MKLSAVLLARVIFFVESVDLNPRGAAFYPDIVKAFVDRYRFQGYPQKMEDYDEQKGVTFSVGKLGEASVDKVVIYNWGLSLETTSSTAEAERLLDDALNWGAQTLKLHYNQQMIRRKAYVSHVSFFSDVPLLSLNPILDTVGDKISKAVVANLKLPYSFKPTGILLSVDPEELRLPVQRFSIERREGIPFSENKYFSSAPVATDLHLQIITDCENALRKQ